MSKNDSQTLRGTLLPDGTLALAGCPSLPAGPVEVTIRPLPLDEGEWFDYLQKARAELEASGYPFRTKEEIDAEFEEMRSGGDDRLDEIWRQVEANRSRRGAPPDILP